MRNPYPTSVNGWCALLRSRLSSGNSCGSRLNRTDNEANKGKHAIDIAELYNRKGEGSIKDLLYDYKEKRRLERIAKGDYQRKGIPPDRKGKYEL